MIARQIDFLFLVFVQVLRKLDLNITGVHEGCSAELKLLSTIALYSFLRNEKHFVDSPFHLDPAHSDAWKSP